MDIDILIPRLWDRFPYMLLVSRNRHTHFPPLPTKVPYDVTQEVMAAIGDHDLLQLTARKLMFSPRFGNILRQYGTSALRYIHGSLNVEDRIAALIYKKRLLTYPKGTSLAGVYREYRFDQLRPSDEQWIRDVYFFDEAHTKFMIICCSYDQAKLFRDVKHIQMDLAFKMVHGRTKTFSIASEDEQTKKIMVYAYVFMNHDSREVYATMFERLFRILRDVGRSPVR